MAKRFTDTNKYKKPFIRSLPGAYKLLWDFLYHDCDHAGIWIVDFEAAQMYVGKDMKINCKDALSLFNSDEPRIVILDAGKRWFIPSFIEFQYVQLSEKNRAHLSVISILNKHGVLDEDLKLITNKPLTSPLQGAMDKDMDKEMDKGKDKDKEKHEIVLPFEGPEFEEAWKNWKEYKSQEHKFRYKSPRSEQASLMELTKIALGNESKAKAIILQSISNGWKGFFELKDNNNGKPTKQNQIDILVTSFAERVQQRANSGAIPEGQ